RGDGALGKRPGVRLRLRRSADRRRGAGRPVAAARGQALLPDHRRRRRDAARNRHVAARSARDGDVAGRDDPRGSHGARSASLPRRRHRRDRSGQPAGARARRGVGDRRMADVMLSRVTLAIALVLGHLLTLYWWIVLIAVLLTWVNPDPYNPIVRFLRNVT